MFYLLVVPVVILQLVMLFKLYHLRKHDRVLYRFCQVRRELMELLREKGQNMSSRDHDFARHMVASLHSAIHNFKDHKKRMFDFWLIVEAARQFRISVEDLKSLPTTDNRKLLQVKQKFGRSIVLALIAYTPIVGFRPMIHIIDFLMWLGARFLADKTQNLRNFVELYKQQRAEYVEGHRLAA